MGDLIERAIDGWQDEKERTATGRVQGHDVLLEKEEYTSEQRGPKSWKVSVYIDNDGPLPNEYETCENADDAQEKFEALVEAYGLSVVETESGYDMV